MKNSIIIGFLIALHATTVLSQDNSKLKKQVVFVCEHGGARSTIASLYFNRMAKDRNLPYESIFRGITPDSSLSEKTKKGLTADGFDTKLLRPVMLDSSDITARTILISLDCKLAYYRPNQEWTGIPAISKDYDEARDEIVKKLTVLINDLQQKNK